MKYPLKTFIGTLVILASVVIVNVGCKSLKKAVDASARLAAQVNNLQDQIEKSYDQRLIDEVLARKATLIVKDKLNPAVEAYTNFVDELRQAYPVGSEAKPTAEQWAKVRTLFRAVTAAFTEITTAFKMLTPEQSVLVSVLISAIQESIDIILGAISKIDTYIDRNDATAINNKGGAVWLILQTS